MSVCMKWAAVSVLVVLLCSCALTEEQKMTLTEYVTGEYTSGRITEAQFMDMKSAIQGGDYSQIIASAANVSIAVLGSLFGVRMWRGSTLDRKGAAPKVTS